MGWCSDKACGPPENYRPGPAAPSFAQLCTGSLIAGQTSTDNPSIGSDPLGTGFQTLDVGPNWSKLPVTRSVPGAQCVVQFRVGGVNGSYPDQWVAAYYDGPPTGTSGGYFNGK